MHWTLHHFLFRRDFSYIFHSVLSINIANIQYCPAPQHTHQLQDVNIWGSTCRQLNNARLPIWPISTKVAFKLCDDLCAMRPSSKQLLTSCRHQNSHILKQFYAHSIRIILFCLLSHFTFLFLLLYHNLTGPCSVCFHWPLQFFSPSPHHTIHLPLSLTIWSSQTDAKIQSDSVISDAVHRFWDSSQRFMTPEWHLALKQGRLALWMQ